MRANSCPCCGSSLLRHARQKGIYWFCTTCHQEMMPLIEGKLPNYSDTMKVRTRTLQAVNS
jgi:ribosomal protein L37AE/L43A